jgi:intracellular sulfur oxidation DsrE/DsrF family protein
LAGVSFQVCGNTLDARKIPVSAVHPEARVVVSGAAEIARLQVEEGHAYYKP